MTDVEQVATRAPLPRRLWLLAGARIVSVGGNGFGRVAFAFGVLGLPHASPGMLSLVLACQAVPQLGLVLLGGVIADRVSRARLLVIAEGASALAWTGLTVLISTDSGAIWLLCVCAAAAGASSSLFSPAMSAWCRR